MNIHLLVGPDGRVWLPGSPDLIKHVGPPAHHLMTSPDLFKDLGFATFRLHHGNARLIVRRELLSRACVRQLTELFIEYEPSRIVIEHSASGSIEILGNLNDAVARLDELRHHNSGEDPRPHFLFESLGLERLRHPKRHQLLSFYMRWKRAQGQMSAQELSTLLRKPITEHALVTRFEHPERPVIATWPRSVRLFKPCEVIDLIGKPVEEQPNRAYGIAAAVGYIAVNREQRPKLELVETTLTLPDGRRRWARYERLLLPWRAGERERLVINQSLSRTVRYQSAGGSD